MDEGFGWQERCYHLDNDLALAPENDQDARKRIWKQFLEERDEQSPSSDAIHFEPSWSWFNVARPLRSNILEGRLVLLDFFTYCCLNCLHILPILDSLEDEFSSEDDEMLIIGVHSAKFANERRDENVREAVKRIHIRHPVVNDATCQLWNQLSIQGGQYFLCWPTIVALHPEDGREIKKFVGEAQVAHLREFLLVAVKHYKQKGSLHPKEKLDIQPTLPGCQASFLFYPGKVTMHNGTLFVSDTGNHRIVLIDVASRRVTKVIGTGNKGHHDGPANEAQFSDPQGTCFLPPNSLLVADTGNHRIREIQLDSLEVVTLCGSGEHGTDLEGGSDAQQQSIASPWDVCLGRSPQGQDLDTVYIAMAGLHQIWAFALTDSTWFKGEARKKGVCFALAGNGKEENRNNSYPLKSGFAQPSGICYSQQLHSLFIADSESSSIRQINLAANGAVKNVCGGARDPIDLFAYGDQDGKAYDAKLQHPLDVQVDDSTEPILYVADTYNHKIKQITDLQTKNAAICKTIELNNNEFNEPGGLTLDASNNRVFVVDTNNSSIKTINLVTFTLENIDLSERGEQTDSGKAPNVSQFDDLITRSIKIPSDCKTKLLLEIDGGSRYELNQDAPNSIKILSQSNENSLLVSLGTLWNELLLEPQGSASQANFSVLVKLYVCDASNGTCSIKTVRLDVTVHSLNDDSLDSNCKLHVPVQ